MRKYILAKFFVAVLFMASTITEPIHAQNASDQYFTLVVYYIRHAQSCANAASSFQALKYTDPELTNCGLFRSLQAGTSFQEHLRNQSITLDFRGASRLRRAKETMLMMAYDDFFNKGATLFQLPYIGESVTGGVALLPENTAEESAVQIPKILRTFPGLTSAQINTKYSDNIGKALVSYSSFRDNTLRQIAKDLYNANPKSTYYAAIVTHSLFMRNHIECKRPNGDKPANNEIYSRTYVFKKSDGSRVKESACIREIQFERPDKIADKDKGRCSYMRKNSQGPEVYNFPAHESAQEAVNWMSQQVSPECQK